MRRRHQETRMNREPETGEAQRGELLRLFDELADVRARMRSSEEAPHARQRAEPNTEEANGSGATAARSKSRNNLRHYMAMRQSDMRPLQERLSRVGLSSLGRCEAHALHSVDAVLLLLAGLLRREVALPPSEAAPNFDEGCAMLEANTTALFGPAPRERAVRIMVTLSTEAADDPAVALNLVEHGADAVRINCAHDDADRWAKMAEHVRAASRKVGRPCKIQVDLGGPKLRTGCSMKPILLDEGDSLVLTRGDDAAASTSVESRRAPCTIPSVLDAVRVGEHVWFDDGKFGGVIENIAADGVTVRVTYARQGPRELMADKGINFPETRIDIPGFTAKDQGDLSFVARYADIVGMSFAERSEDIRAVQERLTELGAPAIGLVLKIETRRGFEALPRLLLESFGEHPVGVMIARGDLALEIGYERLAEVQEEMLWICEAAHVPVIWATQVLETLSKAGMPTRAEITDAAMSGRAECVMLNKGKHIVDAVRILDDILRRMQSHQRKKSATLRPLHVSEGMRLA
jgi:pyruvate kinase